MIKNLTDLTGGLLIVCGHAIYHNGRWFGVDEDRFYAAHVRAGIRLMLELGYEFLAF
jgi:hypothetical protein